VGTEVEEALRASKGTVKMAKEELDRQSQSHVLTFLLPWQRKSGSIGEDTASVSLRKRLCLVPKRTGVVEPGYYFYNDLLILR
jgi:hypothetical protein